MPSEQVQRTQTAFKGYAIDGHGRMLDLDQLARSENERKRQAAAELLLATHRARDHGLPPNVHSLIARARPDLDPDQVQAQAERLQRGINKLNVAEAVERTFGNDHAFRTRLLTTQYDALASGSHEPKYLRVRREQRLLREANLAPPEKPVELIDTPATINALEDVGRLTAVQQTLARGLIIEAVANERQLNPLEIANESRFDDAGRQTAIREFWHAARSAETDQREGQGTIYEALQSRVDTIKEAGKYDARRLTDSALNSFEAMTIAGSERHLLKQVGKVVDAAVERRLNTIDERAKQIVEARFESLYEEARSYGYDEAGYRYLEELKAERVSKVREELVQQEKESARDFLRKARDNPVEAARLLYRHAKSAGLGQDPDVCQLATAGRHAVEVRRTVTPYGDHMRTRGLLEAHRVAGRPVPVWLETADIAAKQSAEKQALVRAQQPNVQSDELRVGRLRTADLSSMAGRILPRAEPAKPKLAPTQPIRGNEVSEAPLKHRPTMRLKGVGVAAQQRNVDPAPSAAEKSKSQEAASVGQKQRTGMRLKGIGPRSVSQKATLTADPQRNQNQAPTASEPKQRTGMKLAGVAVRAARSLSSRRQRL